MRVLGLGVFALGAGAASDLQRARTKVPRDEYRADHNYGMGKVLNRYLEQSHTNVRPCHEWSVEELQAFQAMIHEHREEAYDAIYREADDRRSLLRSDHHGHWAEMNAAAASSEFVKEMQRDGHCHEAVMWWVHHLTDAKRTELKHVTIPTVPLQHWREPIHEEGEDAATVFKSSYNPSSTCLACHGGGIPWQDPDVEPAPYPRQVNNNDRIRRCEEWYGEAEGGACNACEGMAGAYYGDLPDEGIYPACEILAGPEDVAKEDRAPAKYPREFVVEMRGADRWPRTSPSAKAECNYTADCSPYSEFWEGKPIPPFVNAHWYASLHGVLYVDHNAGGQFAAGRLRHESTYEMPAGREGAERALTGRYGDRNSHMTEIHIQTVEEAQVSAPGVMLNLNHKNMTDLNASGVDDTTLDWRRIPSDDGSCTCVADPAGMPWFEGAFDNSTYAGRIRFIPPWQEIISGGPPTGVAIVADHYMKWNFHIFIDVASGLPAMFSSPFGGTATYGNWSEPDTLWPEDVAGGWRSNPGRERCVDPSGEPACAPHVPPQREVLV